jgi:hypothetical protein
VIDHLGTVSSKLEHKMEEKTEITQMEQKLNLLKQVTFFSLQKKTLTDRNIYHLAFYVGMFLSFHKFIEFLCGFFVAPEAFNMRTVRNFPETFDCTSGPGSHSISSALHLRM